MKRLGYILFGFILLLYGCKSVSLSSDIPADYDLKFDIYSHIKWYFRANLKYPSVDELRNFCWEIINEANNNTFSSFNEYENASQKKTTGREELLQCLSSNGNKISFKQEKEVMYVLWKGRKWIKIELNLCDMIKSRGYLFTYFYNSSGHNFKDFDYEEQFRKIEKEIYHKYAKGTKYQPCLLKYDRNKGYEVYCSSSNETKQSVYLKKMECVLDTFLINRDIQMIQFVTNLPQSHF